MSDRIFPTLAGMGTAMRKSSQWSTLQKRSASLREIRVSLASQPLWNFELPFEFLRSIPRAREYQALQGFIDQAAGSFESWLFDDPSDNYAYNELIGTGDGLTASFQLFRTIGGCALAVANVDTDSLVIGPGMWDPDPRTQMWPYNGGTDDSSPMWMAGGDLGAYDIDSNGVITFSDPPAIGVPVYWSGHFYYRCRFESDDNELQRESARKHWSMKGLRFVGSLGRKI